jgi:N-terminal acetyltransferase B complex non-catalytic subunit
MRYGFINETPEMIVKAYSFGSYSKIPEFVEFKKRLEKSIQRAISTRQIFRIELLSIDSWKEFERILASLDIESFSFGGQFPNSGIIDITRPQCIT